MPDRRFEARHAAVLRGRVPSVASGSLPRGGGANVRAGSCEFQDKSPRSSGARRSRRFTARSRGHDRSGRFLLGTREEKLDIAHGREGPASGGEATRLSVSSGWSQRDGECRIWRCRADGGQRRCSSFFPSMNEPSYGEGRTRILAKAEIPEARRDLPAPLAPMPVVKPVSLFVVT